MPDGCPLPLTPLLEVGTTLADKYRIERLIAEGGMGIVYEGFHVVLEQRVAVKVVRPEYAHHPEAVERFLNEARAIARLRGHHIAKVLDTGRTDSGAPYMVLEYLEGRDLRTALDTDGPLPVELAIEYVLQACEAVSEAHAMGLVHRDLKPDNLFITRGADQREVVKVIDFGISKRVDGSGRCLTKQGQSLGSPHYMAPEQMASPEQVDARADVWSLGIVLYELLTNTVPFSGDSLAAACLQVLTAEPQPLSELRPDLPPGLERVVMRCLAKQRDERYATIQDLALDLSAFLPESLGFESRLRDRSASVREPTTVALGEARTLMSFAPAGSAPHSSRNSDGARSGPVPVPGFRRRIFAASAAAAALIAWGGLQAHIARGTEEVASAAPVGLVEREPIKPLAELAGRPAPINVNARTAEPAPAAPQAAAPQPKPAAPAPRAPQRFAYRAPVARPATNRAPLSSATPAAAPTAASGALGPDPAELVNPYPDLMPPKKGSRAELVKP